MRSISKSSVARRVAVVMGALVIGWSMVDAPVQPSGAAAAAVFACGWGSFGAEDRDLVVGVPSAGRGGVVDIHPEWGGSRLLSLPFERTNDRFGAAIGVVGLDGDSCNDLVVGASGRGGAGLGRTGAVYLFFSTASGPGTGARVRLPYAGFPGDGFGSSVAVEGRRWAPRGEQVVGDVRIWVGIPGRDVAGHVDAGAVAYYKVTAGGQVSGPTLYTQNSPGVPGTAEAGDRFGQVLEPLPSGVLVGTPREDVGSKTDAGMITALPAPGATPAGPGPYAASEDTPGIPGAAEAGDCFGAAVSGSWVGTPGEDVGTVRDVGMVHRLAVWAHSFRSLGYVSQNSPGIRGANEPGDTFGASLQAGPLSDSCYGVVAIGVPGEDIGDVKDGGRVAMYAVNAGDPFCSASFSRGPDAREGDRVGAVLSRLEGDVQDGSTVLIGIPGQDLGGSHDAGAVQSWPGGRTFTLSGGSLPGIRYGSVIARFALGYS